MSGLPRLGAAALPAGLALPASRQGGRGTGIVHLGLGAFARAHLAAYTDAAMAAAGGDWLITGVSLRSPAVGEQLNPQQGLYTLAVNDAAGSRRQLVGAVAGVLLASQQRAAVVAALAAPGTHIASFTVTEKGYCRAPDGSLDHGLAADGIYPLLAAALAARRAAGLGGLTLLSLDNLADNGRQLQQLLDQYLAAAMPDLRPWVAAHCAFPCSMVDRIVPATTADDRAAAATALGVQDDGLVVTEAFTQWVVEDRFAGPRPAWEQVGVQIVADVAPYETAKLRMLNGAHSALAYLGLRAGHAHVHAAVADPALRALVEPLMRAEAAPTITPAPGQDLPAYADALLARFANPALNHRLIQIAMDGSQKIPQRWLATLAAARAQGRRCPAILAGLGAWLCHVRGDNGPVDDPLAGALAALWRQAGADVPGLLAALFGAGGLLAGSWAPDDEDVAAITAAVRQPLPA